MKNALCRANCEPDNLSKEGEDQKRESFYDACISFTCLFLIVVQLFVLLTASQLVSLPKFSGKLYLLYLNIAYAACALDLTT